MKNNFNFIERGFQDLLHFFYPIHCACCGKLLFQQFEILCLTCELALSKSNYHLLKDNPLEKKFWGRYHIEKATALFFYEKKGQVQNLLFHLKYKGNQKLGRHLGFLMAKDLEKTSYRKVDMILPVPLHPKKQALRGYNQVHSFADGLGEALNIPVNKGLLIRQIENPSQTGKNRIDRWNNVDGIFQVSKKEICQGKSILLLDDVVTTGATIEACCEALQDAGVENISIASIAVAI